MSKEIKSKANLCLKHQESEKSLGSVVGVYLGGGRLNSGKHKALVEFQGVPTAARVINALLKTPEVDRVIAVTPSTPAVLSHVQNSSKEINYEEPGEKFADSVAAALKEVKPGENIFVLFSDIPFVTPQVLSLFLKSLPKQDVVVPAVRKEDVMEIKSLHNLHFMPCKEGYFHLGSAVFMRWSAIERLQMGKLQELYDGKSFRDNPKKKLEVARQMAGYEGLATAIRIWLSANLQHSSFVYLDSFIPAPTLAVYERILTNLLQIKSTILIGMYADLFLDYDYTDDAALIDTNFIKIQEALEI